MRHYGLGAIGLSILVTILSLVFGPACGKGLNPSAGGAQQITPALTAITPASGSRGTLLTLSGSRFAAGASVKLGDSYCTGVNVVSSEQITCIAPSQAAGVVDVSVQNADSGTATLPQAFTFLVSPTFLYVANNVSDDISIYSINETTGGLTEISGSPISSITGVSVLVIHPTLNFLYAFADSETVAFYTIESDGSLTAISSPISACDPVRGAIHPTGNFLYLACQDFGDSIKIFQVLASGALEFKENFQTDCTTISDLEFDPSGAHLYVSDSQVAGTFGGGVRGYEVGPDGTLSALLQGTVNATEAYLHLLMHPDGRALYANRGNALEYFQRASNGVLTTAIEQSTGVPAALLLVPGLGYIYSISGQQSIAYAYTGDADFLGVAGNPFDLAVTDAFSAVMHPYIPYLYVTHPNSDAITRYYVDNDGRLVYVELISSSGSDPKGIAAY